MISALYSLQHHHINAPRLSEHDMKTTTKSGIPSVWLAVATVVLTSTVHAAPAVTQADLVQAVADGQAFGNAVQTTPMTPAQQSAAASQGVSGTTMSSIAMPPGANNVMGSQYTGTPSAPLTGLATTPSLYSTGSTAQGNSVSGFTGYTNTPADQGDQAAYFVTTGGIHRTIIAPNDPLVSIATTPTSAAATNNSSSSAVLCTNTVTSLPANTGTPYMCIDSYNQFITSCSVDKAVSISIGPVCNVQLDPSSTFGTLPPLTYMNFNGFTWVVGDPQPLSHGIQIGCGTQPSITINLGTTMPSHQCHGGSCNSDYYEFNMTIAPGAPSTYCMDMARIYTGVLWGHICATYDGVDTITIPPWTMADWNWVWVPPPSPQTVPPTAGFSTYTTAGHPGGTIKFTGGWGIGPILSNQPNVDNCVSLSGLL